MADYVVSDSSLASIADAIRSKGGTSAQLAFPNGFISAIQNLGGDGLTNDVKQALLQIGQKVAYIDDQGQQYYNELMAALYPVDSISAVFTQGSAVIYDTDSLDALKQYLVVNANYSDGSSETVTDYTLSGTLASGESSITVSYGGKTAVFSATITHGFHYTTADGKLSEQSYVEFDDTTTTLQETATADGTRIYYPIVSTTNGQTLWSFPDYNMLSHDCEMRVVFKVVDIGWYDAANKKNWGYVYFRITDGNLASASVGIARSGNSTSIPKLRTAVAGTASWGPEVSLNTWHEAIITISGGKQTITFDGATVIENKDFDTITVAGMSRVRGGESRVNAHDVYIREIEFREVQ